MNGGRRAGGERGARGGTRATLGDETAGQSAGQHAADAAPTGARVLERRPLSPDTLPSGGAARCGARVSRSRCVGRARSVAAVSGGGAARPSRRRLDSRWRALPARARPRPLPGRARARCAPRPPPAQLRDQIDQPDPRLQ